MLTTQTAMTTAVITVVAGPAVDLVRNVTPVEFLQSRGTYSRHLMTGVILPSISLDQTMFSSSGKLR